MKENAPSCISTSRSVRVLGSKSEFDIESLADFKILGRHHWPHCHDRARQSRRVSRHNVSLLFASSAPPNYTLNDMPKSLNPSVGNKNIVRPDGQISGAGRR